jgi:hypothetical protein
MVKRSEFVPAIDFVVDVVALVHGLLELLSDVAVVGLLVEVDIADVLEDPDYLRGELRAEFLWAGVDLLL